MSERNISFSYLAAKSRVCETEAPYEAIKK
jgi:hypothetical protein